MQSNGVRPLGRKIVAAILGTTLLALVLSLVLNLVPTVYGYRQEAESSARSLAGLMASSLVASVDFEDAAAAEENLATLSFIPSVTGAAVVLSDGSVFASFGSAPDMVSAEMTPLQSDMTHLTVCAPISSGTSGSFVVISMSLDGQWRALRGSFFNGFIILLGVFIFCFRVAGTVRKRLGDPLHQLTSAIHDISRSRNYSRRVEHASDDELGLLVSEFNSMLGRIEQRDAQLRSHRELLEERVEERTVELRRNQLELMHKNRLLLSEVKKRAQAEMIKEEVERINRHDLKSGLSLVIGYPELMLKEGDLNPRQQKLVKRIRAAGYRMLDMIRNHLDMFKMEKGVYSLNVSRVDLVEVLCDLEEELGLRLSSLGVRLSIKIDGEEVVGDEHCFIYGEAPLLRTMCRNILQNAIEASVEGDVVSVSVTNGERVGLSVSNPAPVPKDIRRRFFEKYVTCGKENGTGLGTYFAALIARTHGANISMKTDEITGTVLTVVFRESGKGVPPHPDESAPGVERENSPLPGSR